MPMSGKMKNAFIKGEFTSDSSTGGELNLFDADGTAITLAENDRIGVLSCAMSVSAAGTVELYMDIDNNNDPNDNDGSIFARASLPNTGTATFTFPEPGWIGAKCGAGPTNKPHVLTSASGVISASFTGYLIAG